MNISFFGLGYVGCVGMGCLAQNGHKVIGIDISSEKIKKINEGMPTIVEAGIDEIIRNSICKEESELHTTTWRL